MCLLSLFENIFCSHNKNFAIFASSEAEETDILNLQVGNLEKFYFAERNFKTEKSRFFGE